MLRSELCLMDSSFTMSNKISKLVTFHVLLAALCVSFAITSSPLLQSAAEQLKSENSASTTCFRKVDILIRNAMKKRGSSRDWCGVLRKILAVLVILVEECCGDAASDGSTSC